MLIRELTDAVTGFNLDIKPATGAKAAAAIRKTLDRRFGGAAWIAKVGGIEWTKCLSIGATRVCVAVAVRISGPSDLTVADICHLRDALTDGDIDIGVLVVPDDELGHYLIDRGPKFSDAVRHVRAARAEDFPLLILGIRHDGPGEPLAKQFKKPLKLRE